MDPPQTHSHSLPPLPTSKLRLMVSYNGHIVPRPQTKSLCYTSGDTRIVAVDRHSTASSFTSFTSHLSKTLYNNKPFVLKYQLPNEDLDSLITISSDEDLLNMLDEHDRIGLGSGGGVTSSRIRLFMFPVFKECGGGGVGVGSLLRDPKSESLWFSDALKSSMRGGGGFSEDGESGDSGKGIGVGQESIVLETCSSFGSINSSVNEGVKVPVESDYSARTYQDQVNSDSESIIYNPSSAVHLQRNPQLPGYQVQHIPDQRQQPVQYIQTASPHYIQYPTGPSPVSPYNSYYPMYVPYQQPPNQPYPIYVMPVGPTDQPYTMPAAPTHVANPNIAYKEVLVPQPTPERVAVAPQQIPSVHPVGPTATATPTPMYENEYDNDLAYAQIYKSQPSAPVFPAPKFETMKNAESDLLSDSAQ